MKKLKLKAITIFLLIISSCNFSPKYIKPKSPVKFDDVVNKENKISVIPWQEFFSNSELQRLIKLALDNNRDYKNAVLNIEVAEGLYGVSRSNILPAINGAAYETRQGVPSSFAAFIPKRQYRSNIGFTSYEVDFFGRIRSLKEAAKESFLSSKEAAKIIKTTIITQTANSYLQYVFDRKKLEIAERAFNSQKKKYNLIKIRFDNEIDSESVFLSEKIQLEKSRIKFEEQKKIAEQDKNALIAIVGVFDNSILLENDDIDNIKLNENLLSFTTSEILLSRPDIQQAEHDLKSSNANIGAARAAFFPSISLTGSYGYASRNLDDLLSSKNWSFTPQINLPIFTGGRNIANLDIANAVKKQKINNYEKVIQNAFRESLDELSERKLVMQKIESQNQILSSEEKQYKIANVKYELGSISLLELLDTDINLLNAKQNYFDAKKEYFVNLIMLYKVMGGSSEIEL
jgi:multidrug efflux system outer membrane protein